MTIYGVADGHNQGSATSAISPQPRCEGIQVTRRNFAADGSVIDEAEYVEFIFDLVGSVSEYQSILTQFGILNAKTNEVTIDVRDATFANVEKNGLAIQPRIGHDVRWQRYFPRDIVILVRDLEDTQ